MNRSKCKKRCFCGNRKPEEKSVPIKATTVPDKPKSESLPLLPDINQPEENSAPNSASSSIVATIPDIPHPEGLPLLPDVNRPEEKSASISASSSIVSAIPDIPHPEGLPLLPDISRSEEKSAPLSAFSSSVAATIPDIPLPESFPLLPDVTPSPDLVDGNGWRNTILTSMGLGIGALAVVRCLLWWSDTARGLSKTKPKNVVILHQLPRGILAPSISCFPLKLETYIRMTEIPYENDFEEPFGPDGRTPWIEINGEAITDSQECIEFLGRYFNKNISSHLSNLEIARGRMVQLLAEHHLLWGILLWRFIFTNLKTIPLIINASWRLYLSFWRWKLSIKTSAWTQGLGSRMQSEVDFSSFQDLRTLSLSLGNKPYFSGDRPTEIDCAVFGVLAQVMWNMPGSLHEKFIQEKLKNLSEFCLRIKDTYWQDWDNCLDKSPKKITYVSRRLEKYEESHH